MDLITYTSIISNHFNYETKLVIFIVPYKCQIIVVCLKKKQTNTFQISKKFNLIEFRCQQKKIIFSDIIIYLSHCK